MSARATRAPILGGLVKEMRVAVGRNYDGVPVVSVRGHPRPTSVTGCISLANPDQIHSLIADLQQALAYLEAYAGTRPVPAPSGCRWCGAERRDHLGQRHGGDGGWHHWTPPTDEMRLSRMKERRAQRLASLGRARRTATQHEEEPHDH